MKHASKIWSWFKNLFKRQPKKRKLTEAELEERRLILESLMRIERKAIRKYGFSYRRKLEEKRKLRKQKKNAQQNQT